MQQVDIFLFIFLGVISLFLIGLLVFLILLQAQVKKIEEKGNKEVVETLSQKIKDVDEGSRQAFERLNKEIGTISEKSEQIITEFQHVKKFEDLLKPPKLRGGMGETLLEELLSQILPAQFYEFQYSFKSREKVDAIIKLGDGLVPVDSKFPLEQFIRLQEVENENERKTARKAFVRGIKSHIDAISQKYILPDEKTYDFALMYIPAENVYYETIIKDDDGEGVFSYALEKCVIPVSPNSFYAYLQVIVRGLKGMRIEEKAKEIMTHLSRLKIDEEKFKNEFNTLGTHISNAKNKYDDASRRLNRFEDKLLETGNIDESFQIPDHN